MFFAFSKEHFQTTGNRGGIYINRASSEDKKLCRQLFNENLYPSMLKRQELAKSSSCTIKQINRWFHNQRTNLLKKIKTDPHKNRQLSSLIEFCNTTTDYPTKEQIKELEHSTSLSEIEITLWFKFEFDKNRFKKEKMDQININENCAEPEITEDLKTEEKAFETKEFLTNEVTNVFSQEPVIKTEKNDPITKELTSIISGENEAQKNSSLFREPVIKNEMENDYNEENNYL